MVRLLYGLGVLALAGAGVVFALWASELSRDDPTSLWLAPRPSAIERFRRQAEKDTGAEPKASPLVMQAEALAKYLAPPPAPKKKEPPAPEKAAVRAEPSHVRAPAAEISPKFTLRGTSYSSWQPERSMALIGESISKMGDSITLTATGEIAAWGSEGDNIQHLSSPC